MVCGGHVRIWHVQRDPSIITDNRQEANHRKDKTSRLQWTAVIAAVLAPMALMGTLPSWLNFRLVVPELSAPRGYPPPCYNVLLAVGFAGP